MLSHVCMTHPEEPRAAESGLRLPNETEYSFGDFMAQNTPYCLFQIFQLPCKTHNTCVMLITGIQVCTGIQLFLVYN